MSSEVRETVVRHTVAWALLGVYHAGIGQQVGFLIGKLGGTPALVALAVTAPAAVPLASFLFVPWGERVRARSLVAGAGLAASTLFLLAALPMGPAGLAVLAFCATAVSLAGSTFYGRLLSRLYPAESRGRLSSVPLFARSAVGAGVSVLAGWLLGTGPVAHRWVLPAAALFGIASALLVFRLPADRAPEPRTGPPAARGIREAVADRRFLLWTLLYSFINIGYWLAHSAKPVYFATVLGFSYFQNGLAVGVVSVTYCLGLLFWGRLVDRFGPIRSLAVTWILVGAGIALVGLAGRFAWVLAGEVLFGIGMAGNELARLLAVLHFAPGEQVDSYMGLFMTLYGVRALSGGLIGVALMEMSPTGSRIGLLAASLIIIVGSAATLALRGRRPRPPANP